MNVFNSAQFGHREHVVSDEQFVNKLDSLSTSMILEKQNLRDAFSRLINRSTTAQISILLRDCDKTGASIGTSAKQYLRQDVDAKRTAKRRRTDRENTGPAQGLARSNSQTTSSCHGQSRQEDSSTASRDQVQGQSENPSKAVTNALILPQAVTPIPPSISACTTNHTNSPPSGSSYDVRRTDGIISSHQEQSRNFSQQFMSEQRVDNVITSDQLLNTWIRTEDLESQQDFSDIWTSTKEPFSQSSQSSQSSDPQSLSRLKRLMEGLKQDKINSRKMDVERCFGTLMFSHEVEYVELKFGHKQFARSSAKEYMLKAASLIEAEYIQYITANRIYSTIIKEAGFGLLLYLKALSYQRMRLTIPEVTKIVNQIKEYLPEKSWQHIINQNEFAARLVLKGLEACGWKDSDLAKVDSALMNSVRRALDKSRRPIADQDGNTQVDNDGSCVGEHTSPLDAAAAHTGIESRQSCPPDNAQSAENEAVENMQLDSPLNIENDGSCLEEHSSPLDTPAALLEIGRRRSCDLEDVQITDTEAKAIFNEFFQVGGYEAT